MKKFYILIGVLLVAIVVIGIFALRWTTPKEPIKVYKTVTTAEVSDPIETDTETALQVSKTGVTDTETSLPVLPEQRNIDNRDSKDAEEQAIIAQSTETEAAKEKEIKRLLRRRDELEEMSTALTNEILAGARQVLKRSNNYESVMFSYLAKVPAASREIAHQALLTRCPDDADSLNDFFFQISDAPTLSLSEISERAREIMTSAEANKIAALQQQARSEEIWNEHRK